MGVLLSVVKRRGLFGPPTPITLKYTRLINHCQTIFNIRDINAYLTRGVFIMKVRIGLCIFLLFSLPTTIFADLRITVEPDKNWGNAPTSNVKKLCENVALHFQEQLRDELKIDGKLNIVYRASGPVAFYRHAFGGASDEYQVGLTVTGTYWAQFSYQFGHEFCHILHNFEDTRWQRQNQWFEEAICELANLWVIRRMSETWAYRAPYPNWVDYRHSLRSYAEGLLNAPMTQFNGTGAEWLFQWENRMRAEEPGVFRYDRVAQLSYKFLPIFEENPEAWNAVRQMPVSDKKMNEYMKEWYNNVDTQDKIFVADIAQIMGISVGGSIAVSIDGIDTDVNNDGYVDLSDVLIVRSVYCHRKFRPLSKTRL